VPGTAISGLLVSKDFSYTLISPDDLREFTGLSTSTILQRQRMVLDVSWSLVRWHLEGMYGSIQEGLDKDGVQTMRVSFLASSEYFRTGIECFCTQVMGAVDLKQTKVTELTMEWVGSSTNDMIADSVLALVLGIDSSPASVKREPLVPVSLSIARFS
jgi:cleavage and polyadenylation specificity factor subunit 3